MALTGTYERTVDDKSRIAVPKQLREAFSLRNGSGENGVTHLFVGPGDDQSLVVYSPADFDKLAQRMDSSSATRADVTKYERFFFPRTEKVELDGQGRIRLPERLVAHAKLQREVLLLGVRDHAEIWDKALWTEFEQHHSARFDEFAQAAFARGSQANV
jgi:MraZ protein